MRRPRQRPSWRNRGGRKEKVGSFSALLHCLYSARPEGGMEPCEPDVPAIALAQQIHLAEEREEGMVVKPALAGAA